MSDELGYISKEKLFLALVSNDAFSNLPEVMKVLGTDTFLEFIEVFGGQTLVVPRMEDVAKAIRDVVIQEKREAGVHASVLAEQYNLTERQVHRIAASVKQASNYGAQTGAGNDA
jgi:Mor family transcriptional regulator